MLRHRSMALVFSAAGMLCAFGCGTDLYPKATVTGRVMCGDKPAWGGVVTFQPVDAPEKTGRPKGEPGGVSRGQVQEDGSFRLTYEARGMHAAEDGAVTGPHRVVFIPPQSTPWEWNPQDDWLPEEEKAKLKEELAKRPVYPKLDCGAELTPAAVEVKSGSNEFEFTLQAAAPQKAVKRVFGSD